jgi:hypothetical protein
MKDCHAIGGLMGWQQLLATIEPCLRESPGFVRRSLGGQVLKQNKQCVIVW